MRKNVLAATPHPAFGELLRLSLEESGKYRVRITQNAEQTISNAEKLDFDLAILDNELPGESLNKIVGVLRQNLPQIRIILIPPDNDPEHPLLAEIGADGCLSRPFYIPSMLKMVGNLLDGNLSQPETGHLPALEKTKSWKINPELWKERMTWAQQDTQAEAIFVVQMNQVIATAGPLPLQEIQDFCDVLSRYRSSTERFDLIRFFRPASGSGELLIYERILEPGLALGVAYENTFPMSQIRMQVQQIVQIMISPPTEMMVYPPATSEDILPPNDGEIPSQDHQENLPFDEDTEAVGIENIPADLEKLVKTSEPVLFTEAVLPTDEMESRQAFSAKTTPVIIETNLPYNPPPGQLWPEKMSPHALDEPPFTSEQVNQDISWQFEPVIPPEGKNSQVEEINTGTPTGEIPGAQELSTPVRIEKEPPAARQSEDDRFESVEEPQDELSEAERINLAQLLARMPPPDPEEILPALKSHLAIDSQWEKQKDFAEPEASNRWEKKPAGLEDAIIGGATQPLLYAPSFTQVNKTDDVDSATRPITPFFNPNAPETTTTSIGVSPDLGPAGDQLYTCILLTRLPRERLRGDLEQYLRAWVPELCASFGWQIEKFSVRPEYIEWTVRLAPTISPGNLVRIIRQHTSQRIFTQFPGLKPTDGSEDFWAPGYLIVSGTQLPSASVINEFIVHTRQRQGLR
jgi:DNA-binding response OmpR family regulator/REP element-mobilizing transposase RayT